MPYPFQMPIRVLLATCLLTCCFSVLSPAQTIAERFAPPPGFQRVACERGSYGEWLRRLPLLPEGTSVKDYRGKIRKSAADTSLAAVIDQDISGRKLEQCMDIILRLRAEYLRKSGHADDIVFLLPDRTRLRWQDWRHGVRPVMEKGAFTLQKHHLPDSSEAAFEQYLRALFYHSHTQVFYHALAVVHPADIVPGDVFIKKGSKGHAVVVLDLAVNAKGEVVALIGQGDTPACQLHILNHRKNQPWIPLDLQNPVIPLPIRKQMTWEGLRRFD